MPLYNFVCACGAMVELKRSIADRNEPANCPDCGLVMGRDYKFNGSVWSPTANGGHK